MKKNPNVTAVRDDATMDNYKKLFIFNFCALVVASSIQAGNKIMDKGELADMLDSAMKVAAVVLPEDEVSEIVMKATAMLSDIGIYEE